MRRELQYNITHPDHVEFAAKWLKDFAAKGLQGGDVVAILTRPRRNKDQNSKLWPLLHDVCQQCQLRINGVDTWASAEDWKDVFAAALKKQHRMAESIDGGVVMLGSRTSQMDKHQFSDLIELIYAYGSERGVVWSEKAQEVAA